MTNKEPKDILEKVYPHRFTELTLNPFPEKLRLILSLILALPALALCVYKIKLGVYSETIGISTFIIALTLMVKLRPSEVFYGCYISLLSIGILLLLSLFTMKEPYPSGHAGGVIGGFLVIFITLSVCYAHLIIIGIVRFFKKIIISVE